MAVARKQLKMAAFINHRMKVEIKDGRTIVGQMLGFDRHMNMVLVDAEEFRTIRFKDKNTNRLVEKEEKRALGLIILRGQEVRTAIMDGAPPADPSERLGQTKPNGAAPASIQAPGISRPAGRGQSMQGPVPGVGVGGPGFGNFAPPGFNNAPGFGRGGFQGPPGGFPPGGPGFPPAQQFAPGFPPPGGRGFGGPPGFPPGR